MTLSNYGYDVSAYFFFKQVLYNMLIVTDVTKLRKMMVCVCVLCCFILILFMEVIMSFLYLRHTSAPTATVKRPESGRMFFTSTLMCFSLLLFGFNNSHSY